MRIATHGECLSVQAPAKLNLFLEVLGKRADGYHELETLMVTLDLHDTLRFTADPSPAIRLRCLDAGSRRTIASGDRLVVPDGSDNLVVQAATLLQQHSQTRQGAAIELWKRIPTAAGLAGGSSDAAATLVALNRLWQLDYSTGQLVELATRLGSDVAFFLAGAPAAVCRGRGEQVEPLERPIRLDVVIAGPATGLSTADVYRHTQPVEQPVGSASLVDSLSRGRLGLAARLLSNSLQSTAEELNPEISETRRLLGRQPVVGQMMTGSGSTCFGLCTSARQAAVIAARLAAAGLPLVQVARTPP